MLRRYSILAILLGVLLNASVLDYNEIKDKPKSLAKDYYIYRLITETKYNKDEIKKLSKSIYRNRGKLAKELSVIAPKPKKKDVCQGVSSKNIVDANLSCKLNRMWPNFVKHINLDNRQKLIKDLANYKDAVNLLKGYDEENPAKYFAKTKNPKNFFAYYKSLSGKEKGAKFDFKLDEDFVYKLSSESYFAPFIIDLVIEKKYANLRGSFVDVNATYFNGASAFFLGLNAISFKKDKESVKFFNQAAKAYKYQSDRDKATFWSYLVTKDQNTLNKLANSKDINMYSLYAKEKTGLKSVDVVIPAPTKQSVENYNIKDPFEWVNLQIKVKNADEQTLRSLANKFDTKETMGEYSYIMNKISGQRDNFYPMPFIEYLKDQDNDRKALIFSIARQESRFIPSAVSISYALGIMQFMPFVANDWAKKEGFENFDQDDMFDPKMAYKIANIHLDWLEKYLYNPVFLAYAYNGGIGFTKKTLLRGDLFNEGKYEPFLSMELVPYPESREYAKKVLANYIIYSQALSPDSNTSILKLFENLTQPSKSDSYRK